MDKIRTKKGRVVNEKTLLVTVDIGKVMNTGYCRCPDKTEIKPLTFQSYIQPASATQEEKTSAGVLKFKHFLGLLFKRVSIIFS